MCTGGGSRFAESVFGSTDIRPPAMANQMRPSRDRMLTGESPAMPTVLLNPSLDAVDERRDRRGLSLGEVVHLRRADAKDALRARHPHVTGVVVDDAVDEAGMHAHAGRVGREAAILEPVQALRASQSRARPHGPRRAPWMLLLARPSFIVSVVKAPFFSREIPPPRVPIQSAPSRSSSIARTALCARPSAVV